MSPIVLVKKKDDIWHMCVDYRELNQSTIKDLSLKNYWMNQARLSFCFKIDLQFGYWQI